MRLGFWNRLAIVAGGLLLLIVPTYATIRMGIEHEATKQLLYDDCMKSAQRDFEKKTLPPRTTLQTALQRCWDWRFPKGGDRRSDWKVWREVAVVTAIGYSIFYLLILALATLGRWVWRGRNTKDS